MRKIFDQFFIFCFKENWEKVPFLKVLDKETPLRRKLEFGAHYGGTRTEYAICLYAGAKELRPTMSSSEIVQKLARHYNEEIKYYILYSCSYANRELSRNIRKLRQNRFNQSKYGEGKRMEEIRGTETPQSWKSTPSTTVLEGTTKRKPSR